MNDNNEGWNEYARLVLNELERHNDILLKINEKLDSIKLQQALYEQQIKQVKSDVDSHDEDIKDLKKRVYKLEQGELVDAALAKYRRWVVAGAFGIVTALLLPIIELVIKILLH